MKKTVKSFAAILFLCSLMIGAWSVVMAAEYITSRATVEKSTFYSCLEACEQNCYDSYIE